MQTQQQKQKARPKHKRSVGELLAAWLLLLWGLVSIGFTLPHPNAIADPESKAIQVLALVQGIFCLVAGLAALLRHHKIAGWLLFIPALCFLSMLGIFAWFCVKYNALLSFLPPIGACLFIVMGFVFLGRWLGQQEDVEE